MMGALAASAAAARAWAGDDAFKLVSISLYLPDQTMQERGPDEKALAAYIEALVGAAKAALAAAPKQAGTTASIVVGLKAPGRSRVWIVGGGIANQRALTALLKAPLEAVPAPPVTGWNALALNFDVWGGGGAPTAKMPIPDEWRLAMQAQGGGMLPDDALKAVWP